MTSISEIMNGVIFVDGEGCVTLINPVAEELLGTKAFQALGKSLKDIGAENEELVRAVISDHGEIARANDISRTVEIHGGEHDLSYVQIDTSQAFDSARQPAGILTVLTDITTEYKSDQLRNQYLSIVAHELRTPLTGIKTFSTMMSKGRLGELNEKQQQAVDSIREQSIRLEHQIDKLINLGNLEADEYAQDPEILNVADLVKAALAPFEKTAGDAEIELVADVNSVANVRVQADRTDLLRALKSLVENAVKFTSGSGRVTVSASVEGGNVCLEVSDTGLGIDPRYHRRIFEKFFQVEDPLTRHHGGAGLGLFVAQGIIEAHGSQIGISSQLGSGSSFRFSLPMFEEDAGGSQESALVAASGNSEASR